MARGMPDFTHETSCAGPVAGVDEAGRGPLAGPVVAAAVIVPAKHAPRALLDLIDDSKKLSPARRATALEALLAAARTGDIVFAIAAVSAREIDRINVLQATLLAMSRAVARLAHAPALVLIDGNRAPPPLAHHARTIIGGDALCFSIAAASIIAKETRDRTMRRLAARHPGYGWERNKGYGTREHLQGIESIGPSHHHRLSFAPLRRD